MNRPYEADNRVSPLVWDHRRSEGSKRQRRLAALKFESGRFVNRPYEVKNRESPLVWDHRRSEGSNCLRRLAAEVSAATGRPVFDKELL